MNEDLLPNCVDEDLLPNYVCEMFSSNNTNNTYNKIYGNQLRILKHNTDIIKYTESWLTKTWNSIATDIQNVSLFIFIQNIKAFLNGEIVVN